MVKTRTVNTINISPQGIEDTPVKIEKENSKYYDARELYIGGSSSDSFFARYIE